MTKLHIFMCLCDGFRGLYVISDIVPYIITRWQFSMEHLFCHRSELYISLPHLQYSGNSSPFSPITRHLLCGKACPHLNTLDSLLLNEVKYQDSHDGTLLLTIIMLDTFEFTDSVETIEIKC